MKSKRWTALALSLALSMTLLEEKLLLLELLEAVQALTTAILSRLTRT